MSAAQRILIIDDEEHIRSLYRALLADEGIDADIVASGRQGVHKAAEYAYPLVVTDLKMPDWDGLTAIKAISQGRPGVRIVVVTGIVSDELCAKIRANPAVVDILFKPFDVDRVRATIRGILAGDGVGDGQPGKSR